jgi:hypothetical protein
MHRVEVVVRFAGDLLDVIELPAGSTYLVGTTPVRAVAGTEATFGLVTVTVSRRGDLEALPRPRIEARPYVYCALSLVAQVTLLVIAFWTAKSEPVSAPAIEATGGNKPGATRIKRFAMPAQTTERTPDPAPSETPVTADRSPEDTGAARNPGLRAERDDRWRPRRAGT